MTLYKTTIGACITGFAVGIGMLTSTAYERSSLKTPEVQRYYETGNRLHTLEAEIIQESIRPNTSAENTDYNDLIQEETQLRNDRNELLRTPQLSTYINTINDNAPLNFTGLLLTMTTLCGGLLAKTSKESEKRRFEQRNKEEIKFMRKAII